MSAAVSLQDAKHHLRIVTNSELREARACMRRHRIKYILRRRPRGNAEPLTFGTLTHAGHEAWMLARANSRDASDLYMAAIDRVRVEAEAARSTDDPISDFMLVTVEELLRGYTARWADVPMRTVAVEQSFDVPLINPETGAASRTFRIGGKFDSIVATPFGDGEQLHVFELKTTGSDIEPGSLYWEKVRALDSQVSIYVSGAKASGYDVADCVYSVIRKPGIKPLKATPEESRKYTQPSSRACKACKKTPGPHAEGDLVCADGRFVTDPGGKLYANMRDRDETPEEYRLRLRTDIEENPGRYYARGTIVRLEHDEREHAFDMWQSAKMLHEAERSGFAPRNVDACSAFGGCSYLGVCTGQASLDDDRLFRTASGPHEELMTVE
jgi:hypothetical protein